MPDAVEQLLNEALQSRRDHRLGDAKRALIEAVELSRREDPRHLALTLTRLGAIERDLHHGEASLALYEEAVALYRAEDSPLRLAHTVRHVGDILYEAQRFAPAEVCVNEALDLYRAEGDTSSLDFANALRSLAVLKTDTGDTAEAKRLWQQVLDLYRAIGISAGVAEASTRLALLR